MSTSEPDSRVLVADFDRPVVPGGYAWWYVDALSDDARQGLTLIAFVGSVFSPYYVRARRRGRLDPADHCAVNVALYGDGPRRWSMTERGRGALAREAGTLTIGPSRLSQNGHGLSVSLNETAVPIPRPVRGRLRIRYAVANVRAFALDAAGRHLWRPIAPLARIDVDLEQPRVRWQGNAYVDTNHGDAPLEQDFQGWQWSRATRPGLGTTVFYDVVRSDGSKRYIGVRFAPDGSMAPVERDPWVRLPRTRWWLNRYTRSPAGQDASLVETLEDTPFYARSLLRGGDEPDSMLTVHESLDLRRFSRPVVQLMLPFRMPRRG